MPCGKGVGAEANTVAGILAGNTDKIRLVVAEMRRAIQNGERALFFDLPRRDSCFYCGCLFFVFYFKGSQEDIL